MARTTRAETDAATQTDQRQHIDEARLAPAYDIVERETVPARSPSAVLAVARREGPASIRAFGLARWDPQEVSAGPDTIYALASITTPFVALAAVQLAVRGGIRLDDRAVQHVPELAAAGAPGARAARERITLRHLLTHTSGLNADWQDPQVTAEWELEHTWEALVRLSCNAPLHFAPGTRFLYSGDHPTLLAEVLRRRTGLRFDAYLRQHVFAPLGMTDTGFFPHHDAVLRPRVAQPASARWPESRTPRTTINKFFPPEVTVPRAGGGLFSSARDLAAFGQWCLQLLGGDTPAAPLSRAALASMLVHQTAGLPAHDPRKGSAAAPFGLGWELPGLDPARQAYWSPSAFGHKGSSGTVLRIDLGQDLVVVFLGSNAGGVKSKERVVHAAVSALACRS